MRYNKEVDSNNKKDIDIKYFIKFMNHFDWNNITYNFFYKYSEDYYYMKKNRSGKAYI